MESMLIKTLKKNAFRKSQGINIKDLNNAATAEENDAVPITVRLAAKRIMVVFPFNRISFGYSIMHSFLQDCTDHPKIFFHTFFEEVRQRIEKSRPKPFNGCTHCDFTFAVNKRVIGEEMETVRESATDDGRSTWCSKVIASDLETKDVTPVIWKPKEGSLICIQIFLDHVLSPGKQKELVESGLQSCFDEDLRKEYDNLIEILSKETVSDEAHEDYYSVLKECKEKSKYGNKISASCCQQELDTISSLFTHLKTTHRIAGEDGMFCFQTIRDHILCSSGFSEPTKMCIRFGWSNEEAGYGMWIA